MQKRGFMVLLAVVCLVFPGFAAEKGVAQLTKCKGDVKVVKGTATTPGRIFMTLEAGDKLQVAAGSEVVLFFFGDNHKEQIQGAASFAVTATGASVPANKKVVTQTPGALKVAGGSVQGLNSDQFGGSVKRDVGGAGNGLSAAIGRKSLTVTPELRWTAVEGATNYVVEVQKDFGEPALVTQTVQTTSLKLIQPLERGRTYIWKVEAQGADGSKVADEYSTDLEIMTDAKVNALKAARKEFDGAIKASPDDASSYIAMAARYVEEGLPAEAIEVFTQLANKNPKNPYPHERLAALYSSMGNHKDAKMHEDKATELSK